MTLRVGIAGYGTIGGAVARALDDGLDGLALEAITTRRPEHAQQKMEALRHPVPVVPVDELAERCDVVVDSAPKAAFESLALPVLRAGRTLVTVSGAALLAHPEAVELAETHGGRIVLASGAILGLDALRAAAVGHNPTGHHGDAEAASLSRGRASPHRPRHRSQRNQRGRESFLRHRARRS